MNWKALAMAVGLAAVWTAGVAVAEEEPGWEFEFEPYGWLFGNYGTVTSSDPSWHRSCGTSCIDAP
ncbi:MAG: hypothetical protein E6J77_03225 [Deltaproteobacteria bacterium]|nr:MAG: hypothetical protein E6J77_03225 [Deltaproteobacteria bacterium]